MGKKRLVDKIKQKGPGVVKKILKNIAIGGVPIAGAEIVKDIIASLNKKKK